MPRLYLYLDPPSPHQLKYQEVGPPLTKLSGSAQVKMVQFVFTVEESYI